MSAGFRIEGSAIDDIAGFYREMNRLLMANEEWRLGESLDALDDALYGGYGALLGVDAPHFEWRDSAHSRESLGYEATRAWLQTKIAHGAPFDTAVIRDQLATLEAGGGQTYFEIILDVFAGHPRIRLDLA